MTRKHPLNIIPIDLIQALQVLAQRIIVVGPKRDIRIDGVEDMVSREEDLCARFIEAGVASGMTGCLYTSLGILSDVQAISFFQEV